MTRDDQQFSEATRLLTRGELPAAQALFEALLERHPEHFDCLRRLAWIAVQQSHFSDAVTLCCRALEIKPSSAEVYIDMGSAMLGLGQAQAAVECLDAALGIDGHSAQAHNNRGLALKALGRTGEAMASYRQALVLDASSRDAWINLGVVQRQLDQHAAALESYAQAIVLQPDYAKAYVNRGIVLHDLGRLDEAIPAFDQALALQPAMAEAAWNKSLALLTLGDYGAAWQLYEWRWVNHSATPPLADAATPTWDGIAPLAGKRILVLGEQGLGDCIQFARYLPLLANQGAHVVFAVYDALASLMQTLRGVTEIVPHAGPHPQADYRVLLMSLPLLFKTTLATIPAPAQYLHVPPAALQPWATRLGRNSRMRVGLVWRGSPSHQNDRKRSIPLDQLVARLPAGSDTGVDYVSLQYQPSAAEQTVLAQHGVLHWAEAVADFSDTAALCAQLDLLISVDTSVAHLSGALGIPCWVLVTHSADWRWLLGRSDCVWYPATRVYRQEQAGDWDSVLQKVAQDLRAAGAAA